MEFVSSPTLCVVFFSNIGAALCRTHRPGTTPRRGGGTTEEKTIRKGKKNKLTNHICYFLSFLVNFKDLCIASKFVGDIKF